MSFCINLNENCDFISISRTPSLMNIFLQIILRFNKTLLWVCHDCWCLIHQLRWWPTKYITDLLWSHSAVLDIILETIHRKPRLDSNAVQTNQFVDRAYLQFVNIICSSGPDGSCFCEITFKPALKRFSGCRTFCLQRNNIDSLESGLLIFACNIDVRQCLIFEASL